LIGWADRWREVAGWPWRPRSSVGSETSPTCCRSCGWRRRGCLLTLPFSNGFPETTEFQKDTYVVALLAAAAATALIISPVAFHRALFRQGRKPELVRYAHAVATGGLAFMLIAMVSSVLLITDFILPRPVAFVLSGVTAVWFLTFWAALPFTRRNWGESDDEDDKDEVPDRVE
jgi:amino acid permease